MNQQRHKRRESFSVLLISNTDRSSRQFDVSLSLLRFLLGILLFVFVVTGLFAYGFFSRQKIESQLRSELTAQEERIQQLTEEKEKLEAEREGLEAEKAALSGENEALRSQAEEAAAALAEKEAQEEAEEAEPEEDPSIPTRYPYSGASVLLSSYTEEQPYLSLSTYTDGTVTAAGNGTVIVISYDDTYRCILEIDHGNGYRTRYLCKEETEQSVEEGMQVQAGDTLLTITADETQVDYQIFYQEEPVDPLSVIDAKG